MSVVRLNSDKVDLYLSIYEGVVRTDYILFQNADLFENPDKSISFNQGTENVGTLVNKDLTLTKIADTNKIRFWITANR